MNEDNDNQTPVPAEQIAPVNNDDVPQIPVATPTTNVVQNPEVISKNPLKKLKAKYIAIIAVVFALIIAGSSYAVFIYLPNTPENVWRHGLAAVGVGLDEILNDDELYDYKNASFTGNIDIVSPLEFGATFDGVVNTGGDGSINLGLDFNSINPTLRTIWKISEDSETAYIKVTQLKELVESFMPGVYEQMLGDTKIENTWWEINSTELLGASLTDLVPVPSSPTNDLSADLLTALNTYMFTQVTDDMVLQIDEVLGVEDFEGVSSQKYLVKLNEENLQSLVEALESIAGSDIEDASMGIDIEDILDGLVSALEQDDVKVEAWVSKDAKILRNIRVSFNDDGSYLDVSLLVNSTEFSEIPIKLQMNGTEEEPGWISALVTINLDDYSTSVVLDAQIGSDEAPELKATGGLSITPSNTPVEVTAPTSTKNIEILLEPLLGNLSF